MQCSLTEKTQLLLLITNCVVFAQCILDEYSEVFQCKFCGKWQILQLGSKFCGQWKTVGLIHHKLLHYSSRR